MGRYDQPVRDWKVRLPKGLNMGKRKYGMRTLQQGMTLFSRKKKNGSRLISSADIRREVRKSVENADGAVACEVAFPKIQLKKG